VRALLWLGVALAVLWIWRSRRGQTAVKRPKTGATATQDMIACSVCKLHVPLDQVWPGRHGSYCSQAHRQQRE